MRGVGALERVLLVGLQDTVADTLRRRLGGRLALFASTTGADALKFLAAEPFALAVVNHRLDDMLGAELLEQIRLGPIGWHLPLLYCMEKGAGGILPSQLVVRYQLHRLIPHPLDAGDLTCHVAELLGLPLSDLPAGGRPAAEQAVRDVWTRVQSRVMERLNALVAACDALAGGAVDEQLRRNAEREAHKLAGSVGTFGFITASDLARQMENLLQSALPLAPERGYRLLELSGALIRELEHERPEDEPTLPHPDASSPLVLIVDDDRELCDRLAAEAERWNARTVTVFGLADARRAVAQYRPEVVVLDLSFPDDTESGLSLLRELTDAKPPIPTVVLTARTGLIDRVEVARLGGLGFLEKPVAASQVMDVVAQVVQNQRAQRAKVLAVDDDPNILLTLRALLVPLGMEVFTLADPLRFWETIDDIQPDLLILDVEMPHISGPELCRVVRNDPRWRSLPVLFLTARTGPDTVHRVFASGGDDFVNKPIVGPELVTRLLNRLERTQLMRKMAETDSLTGLANRRQLNRIMQRFLKLAERQGQPLSFALIDLDLFKDVNDRYGHLVGDVVLRRLGELLVQTFRGEDVVARWGGEEFALGMFGMAREDGVHRLAEVLEALRDEPFLAQDGQRFHVSFSAGVAQFPMDGTDLSELTRAADQALYQAKAAGRDRVAPAGWTCQTPTAAAIILVTPDAELEAQVVKGMATRSTAVVTCRETGEAVGLLDPSVRMLFIDAEVPGPPEAVDALVEKAQAMGVSLVALAGAAAVPEVVRALKAAEADMLARPLSLRALMQRTRRTASPNPVH